MTIRDAVAITPRRVAAGWRHRLDTHLWYQVLYVDPVTGLLRRTDQLPEEKARRRRIRQRRSTPPTRIEHAADCEFRLTGGFWFEVSLAALLEPEYRPYRETHAEPSGTAPTQIEQLRELAGPGSRLRLSL